MHVRSVRSGLTESRHQVNVAAVDHRGKVLLRDGDPDEPFFSRSVIKPVQATVALEAGVDLHDEHLAVAVASHGAFPVHVAIVRAILAGGGRDESALACPPAPSAALARGGSRQRAEARPIYHNCSGKRADGTRGRWWGGPVKGGAAGVIGFGRHGIGIAPTSRSGDFAAAKRLGMLSPAMETGLEAVSEPPVLGGGRPVGSLRIG